MYISNPATPSWPTPQTGVATHNSVITDAMETIVFQFVVDTIGATPTITYKWQGSPDGTVWYDVAYVTDASDTLSVAARTVTAVGATVQFLSNPVARRYLRYRLVTSANTNITYHAEVFQVLAT